MPESIDNQNVLQNDGQAHHPHCFVCSPQRLIGLGVDYTTDSEGQTTAVVACSRLWEGYPGLVHGGIVASLLDGAMTHCLFARQIAAVTADLHVRYRHPVELGVSATVIARLKRASKPLYVLEAHLTQNDKIRARATGKFMPQNGQRNRDVAGASATPPASSL
jgi:uncharacterized protein (TIGR00369 family)